jgi:predicted nucleotidyltransferase
MAWPNLGRWGAMRITPEQIALTRQTVQSLVGAECRVWLFGSRVDDSLRGGDIDLLVDCDNRVSDPALLAARLSARLSCAMDGRKVDVVIRAPNLMALPIHTIAVEEGVQL